MFCDLTTGALAESAFTLAKSAEKLPGNPQRTPLTNPIGIFGLRPKNRDWGVKKEEPPLGLRFSVKYNLHLSGENQKNKKG